ncbi:hypothetical protein V498_04039 [Pseudogymnoascus sp. VKM F-4517 (FW-2822)]|nr:hypothetical protein V498_04039 [Pseudogymnoascus sp. VKM F-4517 (FW-2822)]
MTNRTFSIQQNRELSPVEARIRSAERRLRDFLGRRRTLETSTLQTTLQEQPTGMPKARRRQRPVVDWEASGTEDNLANASEGSTNNRVGDDSGNDHTTIHTNGGRPRQSTASQGNQQLSLGPWTQAVRETVQSMGATNYAIQDLQLKFKSHRDELMKMDEIMNKLAVLEKECEEKDSEIVKQDNTITTLTTRNEKREANIVEREKELAQKEKELDQERVKQEKRVAAVKAEERLKLESEYSELTQEVAQSCDKRKKELEDEFAKAKVLNDKRVTALETEKQQLLQTMDEEKRRAKAQSEMLEKSTEQCDVLERAIGSVKNDMRELEKELERIKKDFALNSQPREYFEKSFQEIQGSIERLSLKYFHDIEGKDLDILHEKLVANDPSFGSVPIDDTDDSHELRAAHAQRIISDAMCEFVWKPLRSEYTLLHPDFNSLLVKLSDELFKYNPDGRVAKVWTALTMRALETLPVNPMPPQACPVTQSVRADHVISKVLSVLSPLVSSSQDESLRKDLLTLTKSAIDVWNNAQSGGLKITVTPLLEPERREEWRSHIFDPLDHDEKNLDVISRTHPRILTLFPRVIAWETARPVKDDNAVPGSFPLESDHELRTKEMCIHRGTGLPELSPLIVRGKQAQEERNDYFSKVIENAKKNLHNNRRGSHSRRSSMEVRTLVGNEKLVISNATR